MTVKENVTKENGTNTCEGKWTKMYGCHFYWFKVLTN